MQTTIAAHTSATPTANSIVKACSFPFQQESPTALRFCAGESSSAAMVASRWGIARAGSPRSQVSRSVGPRSPALTSISQVSRRWLEPGHCGSSTLALAFSSHRTSRGRRDPFFVAALGYSKVREQVESGAQSFDLTFSRGGLRLGRGLAIHVGRRVAIAPRFDIVLPFAGTICEVADSPTTGNGVADCTDTSEAIEDAGSTVDQRVVRKSVPRPWSLAVDLRLVF